LAIREAASASVPRPRPGGKGPALSNPSLAQGPLLFTAGPTCSKPSPHGDQSRPLPVPPKSKPSESIRSNPLTWVNCSRNFSGTGCGFLPSIGTASCRSNDGARGPQRPARASPGAGAPPWVVTVRFNRARKAWHLRGASRCKTVLLYFPVTPRRFRIVVDRALQEIGIS